MGKSKAKQVGAVRVVVERGKGEDTVGQVVGDIHFRSVRAARDHLQELRETWEAVGWEVRENEAVYWMGETWQQGLVVDEKGERV